MSIILAGFERLRGLGGGVRKFFGPAAKGHESPRGERRGPDRRRLLEKSDGFLVEVGPCSMGIATGFQETRDWPSARGRGP